MAKGKKTSIRVSERMKDLVDNPEKFAELDDDEVYKGRLKAADGTFKGRPPSYVPAKFNQLMREELIRRWEVKVAETLAPSMEVLREISQGKISGRVPADARMKSAIYLIERTVGKVPDKVEAKVSVAKWEEDIGSLIYDPEKE